MIRSMIKTAAYTRAPKTTFSVLHPRRAIKLRKLQWDLRHAYAPRIAALGVLALALPVGYLLGRSTSNHHDEA